MSAPAIVWLAIPLVAMVAGFLAAIRLVARGDGAPIDGYTPDGLRTRRGESRARLLEVTGSRSIPGLGSLLLTDEDLVFERYFPRGELRVKLRDVVSVSTAEGARDVLTVECENAARWRVRAPDSAAWADAIRRAAAARRQEPGSPIRAPSTPAR
jgi:hypothetical protein